ncbi:MAG TPA: YggS family pyridoxal phosphate-dependent enzyme [Acidimicrobiia bacterium]
MSDDGIPAALARVRERITDAARRAGRDPAEITLVGVSKTVPAERVAEAVDAGLGDLGENRAQELLPKARALAGLEPRWHFVGTLQRNKIAALAPWVDLWHSIDRADLVPPLARHAPRSAVLVQVNLAGKPGQSGCAPDAAKGLVDECSAAGLEVRGLMTIAPQGGEKIAGSGGEKIAGSGGEPRRWFAALRDLATTLRLPELSMGMTEDFEDAIAEGATLVRVGRAIFGERPPDSR